MGVSQPPLDPRVLQVAVGVSQPPLDSWDLLLGVFQPPLLRHLEWKTLNLLHLSNFQGLRFFASAFDSLPKLLLTLF